MPLGEAQRRLIALREPLPPEECALRNAAGRYPTTDIIATRDQPAGDMSAMDGYAVTHAAHTTEWELAGECRAGRPPCPPIEPGKAARIFTGALLPEGADTVIMQENIRRSADAIELDVDESSFVRGRHVRRRGSDFAAGDVVWQAGRALNPAALAAAAMAGHGAVQVSRAPRVAILSTGDELVAPGRPTKAYQIPASNDVMLEAMVRQTGGMATVHRAVADDLDSLCSAIDAVADHDVVVTTGGASVGDHDLIGPAYAKLGADIDFWKVAMKPGKPVMAGTLGNSVILALPGNPASAFVAAVLFLLPLLRHLGGAVDPMPEWRTAPTRSALQPTGDRDEFLRALVNTDGIEAFGTQDSAGLSTLASANALLFRPAGSGNAAIGDAVSYIAL